MKNKNGEFKHCINIYRTDIYKNIPSYRYFWEIWFYGNNEYKVMTYENGITYNKPCKICNSYDEALNTLFEFMEEKRKIYEESCN